MSEVLSIVVKKGTEYQAIEEDICDSSLFFAPVYQQAKYMLDEIVLISEQLTGKDRDGQGKATEPLFPEDLQEITRFRINNILALCANRGYGKTSALLSFIKGIEKLGQSETNAYWKGTRAQQYKFEILDIIDPSSMEKNDSLVKMVLSRMFAKYSKEYERRSLNGRHYEALKSQNGSDRDEMEELFLKCYYNAEALHNEKVEDSADLDDMYDHITNMGYGTKMREMLYELFGRYLNSFYGNNSFLVIPIDDADLNAKRVYEMLEEIRKYLMLPRVVILMATNMEQLECAVEQHFISVYEKSLIHKGDLLNVDRCHIFAEHYLQKTIPVSRRIYLPDINQAVQSQFSILKIRYIDNNKNDILMDAKAYAYWKVDAWNIQQQLLYYLHRKTGLLFIAPKSRLHNILPNSMRDLMQFLAYFETLEDIEIGYEEIIKRYLTDRNEGITEPFTRWSRNLECLQTYILHHWSGPNLSVRGRVLLHQLADQQKEKKFGFILRALPEYYAAEQHMEQTAQSKEEHYNRFLQECEKRGIQIDRIIADGSGQLATYADMVTAVSVLDDLRKTESQAKFSYAIHLYFSIYLHQIILAGTNEKHNELTETMRDGLFRDYIEGNIQNNFPYWRLSIPADRWKSLRLSNNQTENSVVAHVIRVRLKGANPASLFPYKIGKDESVVEYIFHPLYPLMYEMDILNMFRYSENGSKHIDDDGKYQLLVSMIFVLNLDVQLELMNRLRGVNWEEDNGSLMERLCLRMLDILDNLHVEYPILHEGKRYVDNKTGRIRREAKVPFSQLFSKGNNIKIDDFIKRIQLLTPSIAKWNYDRYSEMAYRIKDFLKANNGIDDIAKEYQDEIKEDHKEQARNILDFIVYDLYPIISATERLLSVSVTNDSKEYRNLSETLKQLQKSFNKEWPDSGDLSVISDRLIPSELPTSDVQAFLKAFTAYIGAYFDLHEYAEEQSNEHASTIKSIAGLSPELKNEELMSAQDIMQEVVSALKGAIEKNIDDLFNSKVMELSAKQKK